MGWNKEIFFSLAQLPTRLAYNDNIQTLISAIPVQRSNQLSQQANWELSFSASCLIPRRVDARKTSASAGDCIVREVALPLVIIFFQNRGLRNIVKQCKRMMGFVYSFFSHYSHFETTQQPIDTTEDR